MDTKKLRQKILDLAIRGKLVPQDPNDEPASVLLERIRAEKEQLIKEGKIKRSKKSAATDKSHYENVPFEIPESWVWTILGNIGEIITGTTPPKDNKEYYGGNIPFYKPTDLDGGIMTNYALDTLTDIGYEQCRKLPSESVLVTCIGATIGKVGVIRVAGACNQQINAIIPSTIVDYRYLYYALTSDFLQREILEHSSSTTLPIINKGKFSELPFPLPSLGEQNRIVIEVEKWFDFIADIEGRKVELEAYIRQAKSKILDLAISGKLVPQDPNDEPAIELLKRINPDFQPCDNSHYENLPENWCLAKVKDVFAINPRNKAEDNTIAGFIPMTLIDDGYSNTFSYEKREWGSIKTGFTHFADGDVAVAKISPCLENRKSIVLRDLPNGIGAGTTELHVFRSSVVVPEYALYFFKSEYFISKCVGTFNGVVGQQRVGKNIIEETQIPIPPINEQTKIVSTIETIFTQLNTITAEL